MSSLLNRLSDTTQTSRPAVSSCIIARLAPKPLLKVHTKLKRVTRSGRILVKSCGVEEKRWRFSS